MAEIKKYLHTLDIGNNKIINLLLNPLSTSDRTTVGSSLTNADEGYVCYDTDENVQYFWDGSTWIASGGGGGSQTLQQVTTLGNTTTNNIQLLNAAETIYGAGGGILLDNGSRLREGTIDAGLGGSKGIAQICAVGYELKWEAGILYVMNGNGNSIRQSLYNFTTTPAVTDDSSLGYAVGSLWTLDNGIVYECADATTGAAVWNLVNIGTTPNLQQVTDVGNSTTNDIILNGGYLGSHSLSPTIPSYYFNSSPISLSRNQVIAIGYKASNNGDTGDNLICIGNSAGTGNSTGTYTAIGHYAYGSATGSFATVIGDSAAQFNSGNYIVAIGKDAAISNSGNNSIFLGESAGSQNSGHYSNHFINANAGGGNIYDFVNLFGFQPTATEHGQIVFGRRDLLDTFTIRERLGTDLLTASRLHKFPNADGTFALSVNGVSAGTDGSITIPVGTGTVTSVGLSMPSAFTVTSGTSPVTTSGTLTVTGAGTTAQYVRGDGTLATYNPGTGGGGASVSFYLNGSVDQTPTIGGLTYKQMSKTPFIGSGTDFTINADGYIQSFITDVTVPNQLLIPGGNWIFEMWFSASSGGGSPKFYVDVCTFDGTTLTTIGTSSVTPENITGGTAIDLYTTAVAVPQTILLATDRIAIRVYVIHSSKTIKLHTEDSHLCQVITTFSTGITALNGLTDQVQNFATPGTTGTSPNWSSVSPNHTLNIPLASTTSVTAGLISKTDYDNFTTAYTDRLKWDGGSTGLVAANGRTSLGATTVGDNFFTLTNPSAITFPRINADNSISTLDASTFRTAIGAGTGVGDMVLASTQTNSGAKTFLDTTLLLRNVANTANGSFTNTNTVDRVYTLPDATTTLAGLAVTQTFTGLNSFTNNTLNTNVATINLTRTNTSNNSITENGLRINSNFTATGTAASFVNGINIVNTNSLSSTNGSSLFGVNIAGTSTISGNSNFLGALTYSPTINDNNSGANTNHRGIILTPSIILGSGVSTTGNSGFLYNGTYSCATSGSDVYSSAIFNASPTFASTIRNTVGNWMFQATPIFNNSNNSSIGGGFYFSSTGTNTGTPIAFQNVNGNNFFNSTSGSTGIGTAPNATYKLDVGGNTRIGASTSGNKLNVLGTDNEDILTVNWGGSNSIGLGSNTANNPILRLGVIRLTAHPSGSRLIMTGSNTFGNLGGSATMGIEGNVVGTSVGTIVRLTSTALQGANRHNPTSGTLNMVTIGDATANQYIDFSPASGSATFNSLYIRQQLNTSGSYSGIVRGVFYDPILTSTTGINHIAFENTTGDMVFNSTSGVVMIGSATSSGEKLQVTGTSKFTGTLAINAATMITNGTTGGVSITTTNNELYLRATNAVYLTNVRSVSGSLVFGLGASIYSGNLFNFNANFTGATGTGNVINISSLTNSTQAGGIIRMINISPTYSNDDISQTFTGIRYAPTVSGLVASSVHNFINATTGNVLLGTTSGSVGIGAGITTPNSTLQVVGSISNSYVAKTATYPISSTDYTIDCTANSFTVTLPTAVGITGRIYIIKNSGTGTITLATTSSQTIDGATSKTLNIQYSTMQVQSTGANWIIIANF